ncbi:MAG: glycosyltransferase, partial [Oscillospiraceae bacterium]|nr:glycosyltransferase [Oscillospiraceae bacterium]
PLAERLEKANKNTFFIPNGANFERFLQASRPQVAPEGMSHIKHPIFGFVGALQPCIEYGYAAAAAKARADWNFVFIGGEKPGADLSELRKLPNVHFLGLKPNEQLPQYMAQFDACLNLFADNELSKDVSPLKFYEYLATGKPVVSTPQPEQVLQFAPIMQIARSEAEFISCCEQALTDNTPERSALRIEEGRKSSWDSRVAQMEDILREQKIF